MLVDRNPQSECEFAIAVADITPPVGLYHRMWGAATHDRSEGIHRPLRATVAILSGAQTPPEEQLVIVALDHCLLGAEEMQLLRTAVASGTGVSSEQMQVIFSHSHAAGLMSLDRVELPGGDGIPAYLDRMVSIVVEMIQQLRTRLQPATIVYGTGYCDVARFRDLWDSARQEYVCGFNPQGPSDSTLVVGRVTDSTGAILATIVNYACHPTTLAWDNRLVSPDFPGAMRELVEAVTSAPCLFIQGASGDLGPREGFVGDTAVADRHGRKLGYSALSVLEGLDPPLTEYAYQKAVVSGATIGTWAHVAVNEETRADQRHFARKRQVLELAYRPGIPTLDVVNQQREQLLREEQDAVALGDHERARDRRARVERLTRMRTRLGQLPRSEQYPFEIMAWRIGAALWVFVPGEHYQLLQRQVRAAVSGPVIVATMANGWGPSYLPTRESYDTGIYQETIAVLAPGALEQVSDAVARQLREMESQ